MKNKNLETLMYSAGGILALALILVAANFIFSALNARVDLTEGRVYTLSEGTRSILGKLEAPVKIRFYYSQGSTAVPPACGAMPDTKRPAGATSAAGSAEGCGPMAGPGRDRDAAAAFTARCRPDAGHAA